MIGIHLNPLDTLFFRDGRPFDQVDEGLSRGVSVFPPPPTTLYGAARVLASNFLHCSDIKVAGSVLTKGEVIFVPTPYHLRCSESKPALSYALTPKKAKKEFPKQYGNFGFVTQYANTGYNGETPQDSIPWPEYIKLETLLNVRNNNSAGFTGVVEDTISVSSFLTRETAAGIERDAKTSLTKDGAFYTSEKLRLDPEIGFRVDIKESDQNTFPEIIKTGLVRLGGEARSAQFRMNTLCREMPSVESLVCSNIPGEKLNGNFMLIALSPVVIAPEEEFGFPLILTDESTLYCRAVMASGLETIGWWNKQKSGPEPKILRCYPAGSVFFMNIQNSSKKLEDLQRSLIVNGLGKPEHTKIGFGKMLLFKGWK